MGHCIYVRDFTVPGDWDSAEGIRQAIKMAKETGADELVFEAGKYLLTSWITSNYIRDERNILIAEDVGTIFHIYLDGLKDIRLKGAVDAFGEPATILVGYNDKKVHSILPAIVKAERCSGLTVEHIAFDRYPQFASAGKIIDVSDCTVTVEVTADNPCYDGMGTYCINRFSADGSTLTGESVTYGHGSGQTWQLVKERTLQLENAEVASKVNKGEYLSWHQGALTDFQVNFFRCDNLSLHNIRTYNSNGFAMLTYRCNAIKANKVVFKPKTNNQLFTAPRDAWKIKKCGGVIEVTEMVVEGVRMDGQNMHSHWLEVYDVVSQDSVMFNGRAFPDEDIPDFSEIEFYLNTEIDVRTVLTTNMVTGIDGIARCLIKFTEDLPNWVTKGSLAASRAWEPSRYSCIDSHFRNIAGAGHLVRFDNLVILNCKYENLMNPGILLGAEHSVHLEGGHATNVLIKWCEFTNCGFHPRYETIGCIGIRSEGLHGPHNKNIVITDNIFRNSDVGIHITDAQDVYLIGNRFEAILEPIRIEAETTCNIVLLS